MSKGVPVEVLAPDRVRAVDATGLAGADAEAAFDQLAHLAATVMDTPIALFSVVDAEFAWYKGAVGLPDGLTRQGSIDGSFCKYVIASGDHLVVADARTDPRTRGNPAIEAAGVVAWAGFPIDDPDGHTLGSFCVVDTVPRRWTSAQLEALRVLSVAAANQVNLRLALQAERAARDEVQALRERERTVVELFQRSLLPTTLPDVEGLTTAVRYVASNESAEMGGDWYDVATLASGATGLIVGDVCGHDLGSVASMAQMRHSLHVLALNEPDPVRVLELLDHTMVDSHADRFATLVYAQWEPLAGDLRFVSAGHPPPLVVRADGRAELCWDGRRPLLGVGLPTKPVTAGVVHLAPGDRVALFTDGLFERRGSTMNLDLEHLRLVAEAVPPGDADDLCDALLAAMSPAGGWDDDVALLAIQRR